MKVDLRYPLVLRHVPKGLFSERHLACSRVATVEITELADTAAPVVVEWVPEVRGAGVGRRFRLFGDDIMGPVNHGRARICRYDDSFPCAPLALEAKAAITKIVLENGYGSVIPSGKPVDPTTWNDITRELPRQCNLDDERFWDQRFSELVSRLVAIDQEVWRVSAEPLICVHRNSFGWHTSVVTEQDIGQDLMRLHFTIDRWEEARETCERLARGKVISASRLEYNPAYVPAAQTDITDISIISARVVAIVNAETDTRARSSLAGQSSFSKMRPKITWERLPAELFGAYAVLRQFNENIEDRSDRSVSAAVDALQALIGLSGAKGLSWLLPQAESVQAHVDKWNSRPIEIDMKYAARPTHGFRR